MRRISHVVIQLISILFVLSACMKENIDCSPTKIDVEVLFTPEGFSNTGYSDIVLKAVEKSAQKYGFEYSFCVPDSLEIGMEYYMDWYEDEIDDDVDRSLFIFTSGVYESMLSKAPHPSKESGKELLVFEVPDELPYAYTFQLSYYGAAYFLAGFFMQEFSSEEKICFHIISANPFLDGQDYLYDGIADSIADSKVDNTVRVVKMHYLSSYPGGGLDNQDYAYLKCKLIDNENPECLNIYIPFAGNSNMGVHRFAHVNVRFSIGIDSTEPNDYSLMPLAMNKRMDLAIDDFFNSWISGDNMAMHTLYTLESGRVELVPNYDEQYLIDQCSWLLEQAKVKEKEYFKSAEGSK